MANDKLLRVGIEIGGSIGRSLDASIRNARAKLGGLKMQVADIGAASRASFSRIADSGMWRTGAVAAGAYFAVIGNGTRQAAALNQELSGLQKHLDGLDASGMARIQKDVLNLSARTGVNASDTAGLFVAGAESGRKQSELGSFAQLSSRSAIATGMTPDVAGTTINQLQAAAGLDLGGTARFMDQINGISDRLSTTAPKLSDFASRTAGLTQQMKLSTGSLTTFGGVMLDSGVAPEIAATSLHAMTRALVAGTSATGAQREAYTDLGLTAEAVAKGMQTDAEGTINDVIRRLKGLAPERRQAVAYRLFGAEASKGLTPLVNNFGKLQQLQADVRAGRTIGSIEKEHSRWLTSNAGQTALLQANTAKLSITLGATLAPALNRLLTLALPIAEGMARWAEKNPKLTAGLVALGGVVAGLVIAAPALAAGLTLVKGAGALLLGLKLGATIAGWLPVIVGAGKVLLALATGPVGLTVAAVLGLGAVLVWAFGRFDWLRAGAMAAIGAIGDGWRAGWDLLKGIAAGDSKLISDAWNRLMGAIGKAAGAGFELVRRGATDLIGWLLQQLAQLPGRVFKSAMAIGGAIGDGLRHVTGLGGDSPANNIRPIPRARGGQVTPGRRYIVGEKRPELLEVGNPGRIYPNLDGLAGGGGVTLNVQPGAVVINAPGADPERLDRAVAEGFRRLQWELQSGYRSLLND